MTRLSSQCCVPFCPGTGEVLHRFPIPGWESAIIKEWVSRIASEQTSCQDESRLYTFYRVCDLHFSEHCRVPDKTRLKKGSLPTLLLPGFVGPSNAETSILATALKPLTTERQIYVEEEIKENKENCQPLLKKPSFFVSLKTVCPYDNELQEVCRICFKSLDDNNYTKLSDDGKNMTQFKEILMTVLPELDQKMYPGVVICSLCENLIISSYKLKDLFSKTSEKLKQIIEKEEYTLRYDGTLVITELTPHMKILMDHNYTQNRIPVKKKIASSGDEFSKSLSNQVKMSRFTREKIWGKGPYLCDKCGYSCARIAAFRYHLVNKHGGQRQVATVRRALCELCGKVCKNVYSLNKHLRYHKIVHKCSYCSKIFLTFRSLQTHYRTTHGAFQQCRVCAKVMRRGKSMKAHLVMHKYEKKN